MTWGVSSNAQCQINNEVYIEPNLSSASTSLHRDFRPKTGRRVQESGKGEETSCEVAQGTQQATGRADDACEGPYRGSRGKNASVLKYYIKLKNQ